MVQVLLNGALPKVNGLPRHCCYLMGLKITSHQPFLSCGFGGSRTFDTSSQLLDVQCS